MLAPSGKLERTRSGSMSDLAGRMPAGPGTIARAPGESSLVGEAEEAPLPHLEGLSDQLVSGNVLGRQLLPVELHRPLGDESSALRVGSDQSGGVEQSWEPYRIVGR